MIDCNSFNIDGIKFTVKFDNDKEVKKFYDFISTLNITKSTKRLKSSYQIYKLKYDYYNKTLEQLTIDSNFYDIEVSQLGPDILRIYKIPKAKQIDKPQITLNFHNILHYSNITNYDSLNRDLQIIVNKIYKDKYKLIKSRFAVFLSILEYIKENKLSKNSRLKEINFIHHVYDKKNIAIFNLNQKKFSDTNYSLKINNFYAQINKIELIEDATNLLSKIFINKKINVKKNILNKSIKLITSDETLKSIEIEENDSKIYIKIFYENKQNDFFEYIKQTIPQAKLPEGLTINTFQNPRYETLGIFRKIEIKFKPLIDAESSYINYMTIENSEIRIKSSSKGSSKSSIYKSFECSDVQIIRTKIRGWFTTNKEILEKTNSKKKYYYSLSDSFEDILNHINKFINKYKILKIELTEEEKKELEKTNTIEEDIELSDEGDLTEDDLDYYFQNKNYEVHEEDFDSTPIINEESEDFDLFSEFNKICEINQVKNFVTQNEKISLVEFKKFLKKEIVSEVNYKEGIENLAKIYNKLK